MSVDARSFGSVGRPIFGRPAAAVVVALIAMLAVGAPAALAGETSNPDDPVSDVPETTTAPAPAGEAPPADPPAADPPAVETPPVDQPPAADPPSVDTPPAGGSPPAGSPAGDPTGSGSPGSGSAPADSTGSGSPPSDSTGSGSPPADSTGSGSPPAGSTGSGSPPAGPPASGSPATGSPAGPAPAQSAPAPTGSSGGGQGNHSVAQNVNRVIQAVYQVQHGCRSYCYGTSQTQRSLQVSETNQSATAISGGSSFGGSSATAGNESSTIQFVWQMQIGCVAFCYHTSQSQEASQQSNTTQEAIAESALTAWAENLAETVQYVFQMQQGCEHECHGVTQHQSSTQGQTTNQSATGTSGDDGDVYGVEIGAFEVPAWLIAYAANIGATIQTIYQFQEAVCVEHCTGEAQLQEAAQRAETDQRAVARAAPPPEPPPVAEPPGAEPPGEDPLPTDPGPAPDGGESTAPSATGPAPFVGAAPSTAAPSIGPAHVLARKRKRATRRHELELRADGSASGGAPTLPGGPAVADRRTVAGGPALVPVLGDGAATTRRTASGNSRETRADGEQLPARAVALPAAPSSDGSLGWLAILFLAATLMVLGATLRRGLASNVTQI
jgi:hypothetical protein